MIPARRVVTGTSPLPSSFSTSRRLRRWADRSSAPLYADPDVYAFARTLEGSMLIAAVNVAEDARRFEIPLAGSLTAQPATPTISCSRQAAHPPPS